MVEALGTRLRDKRIAVGLTQQQLAAAAGVGITTVRDLERGRTFRPHPRCLGAITSALNISADEIRQARAAPVLYIQTLGPLKAWHAGRPLDLGPVRQCILLGILAARCGESVAQDVLADMLWGHRPPHSWAGVIHTYVSRLRRILEPGCRPGSRTKVIVTTSRGYQLRLGTNQLDYLVFRRWLAESRDLRQDGDAFRAFACYQKALSHWHGHPFADLIRLRCQPEVAALASELAAAVLECADLACALGQARPMIGPLREINSWDPFNGAAQAQLIRTLIAAGERAAAVRAFNQIQALLADELGVDPDQPVVEAYLHALNGSAKGAGR